MVASVAFNTNHLLLWIGEVIGFAILAWFFAGKKFGANRKSALDLVNGVLDSRAARVDAQLKIAEESKAEAAQARQEAQAAIGHAREEALHIVERSHGMESALREEMTTTAEDDRNRILAQAREAIEGERNRAIQELRSKAADVAVDAAREVLRRTMDEKAERHLVLRALSDEPPPSYEATP